MGAFIVVLVLFGILIISTTVITKTHKPGKSSNVNGFFTVLAGIIIFLLITLMGNA